MTTTPRECVGLMGRLFGHKFVKGDLSSTHLWDHCFRCGRKAGQ